VERAINMSHDKYCSATIMLAKTAEITTTFELRGLMAGPLAHRFKGCVAINLIAT
jgi:hypothetical protein